MCNTLIEKKIFCRIYWYLINKNYIRFNHSNKGHLKIEKNQSKSLLCLPNYPDLSENEFNYVLENFDFSIKL